MKRLLLLLPTTTYRTKAFLDAALSLNIAVTAASEKANTLAASNPGELLTLDLYHPDQAALQAQEFAQTYPIDAIIPVDEDTAVAAAHIAQALSIKHNPIAAVTKAKNKYLMRMALQHTGLNIPQFWPFSLDTDLPQLAAQIIYPAVLKPAYLSTSRGVMRIDQPSELISSVARLNKILARPDLARRGGDFAREALVEEFIPGFEVAVEGLFANDRLQILAIYDKPDPLNGPFFEETIYITPSRLSLALQQEIAATTERAAQLLGFYRCPIHAELRINDQGVWLIEIAARAIGGLCASTLRFPASDNVDFDYHHNNDSRQEEREQRKQALMTLEEIIVSHALGEDMSWVSREDGAAGVMMIPIPKQGILRAVNGLDNAKAESYIEDVIITAHITQHILPPPEGGSYLGFIFSRAKDVTVAEAALRAAHRQLEFIIE